jgi:hypothetical protein
MFTHAAGRHIWDLVYEIARAANWVIIPVGCPTCVPAAEMVAHVPDELCADALVVNSGEDVLHAIVDADNRGSSAETANYRICR